MEIVMARGDLEERTFQVRMPNPEGPGTVPYAGLFDEIYMTVKKYHTDREYLFQKRLSKGEILPLGEGTYLFAIEPADTDGLAFGDYEFDIELLKNGEIKKTFAGKLRLEREVTHAANEGARS